MFCSIKKKLYLCIAIEKNNGSIAQLNRAFDYGSKGYRFESYWSHSKQETNICSSLFLFHLFRTHTTTYKKKKTPQETNLGAFMHSYYDIML